MTGTREVFFWYYVFTVEDGAFSVVSRLQVRHPDLSGNTSRRPLTVGYSGFCCRVHGGHL